MQPTGRSSSRIAHGVPTNFIGVCVPTESVYAHFGRDYLLFMLCVVMCWCVYVRQC